MREQYYVATPIIIYIVSSPDYSRHGAARMTTTCGARTYMISFLAKVVAIIALSIRVCPPPSENPESSPVYYVAEQVQYSYALGQ